MAGQRTAHDQIANRTGTSSLLFSNPISSARWYFNPVGMTIAARTAAKTGSFYLMPFSLPSFIFQKGITSTASKWGASAWWSKRGIPMMMGAGGNIGGAGSYKVVDALSKVAGTSAPGFNRDFRKMFNTALQKNKWMAKGSDAVDAVIESVSNALSSKYSGKVGVNLSSALKSNAVKKVVGTSLTISKLGSILSPISTGWLAGELVGRSLSLAFKAGISAVDYVSAQAEHIRALEFGGTLGAGYATQAAATERQRAVQALQRTHLGGRRGLGTEAATYSAII